jgi:hypothetical protein
MLLTCVTLSMTVTSILLRGLVIDPHVVELLHGLVIDPHVAELLGGLVIDPHVAELLHGLVVDCCIAEYLCNLAHDPRVDDPFHSLLVEFLQCNIGAVKTPPVFVSSFSKARCGIQNRLWLSLILGILLLAEPSTRALAFNFYFHKVQVKINQAPMVSTGTPKAKETNCKDHPDESPLEMKVKTEREKSKDSMDMLAYFNKLPDNTREELLSQLCLQCDPHASTASELQPKKNLEEYRSEMDNASDGDKSRLYDDFIETQHKKSFDREYMGKIPALQTQLGLQFTLATCTDRDLGDIKVILRKQDRGADPISCKKTRDKVVKLLDMKISAGNLSCMLTSVEANEYDVAAGALSWQTILKSIRCFCSQYNMTSLIMIPQGVDLSKPHHVAKAIRFNDAIEDWHELSDADYFAWQEFVLGHGTDIKLESDNWLDNVLHLSMETTLCSEIKSDLNSIPKHQHGSVTTLCCIIKRMVVHNQEAQDALKNYIKTFDITKFPGENVPIACLHLKAAACDLGERNLPTNAVRRVLEGFVKSSTSSFNKFCTSQIALLCGSFYDKLMSNNSL